MESDTERLQSIWARVLPPALLALAWWLSGVTLVTECEGLNSWKILGLVWAVCALASIGPDSFAKCWGLGFAIAAILLAVGLVAGYFIPGCCAELCYCAKLLYAAMHACIIASLGILIFLVLRGPQGIWPSRQKSTQPNT
jgi:hypothetical protein